MVSDGPSLIESCFYETQLNNIGLVLLATPINAHEKFSQQGWDYICVCYVAVTTLYILPSSSSCVFLSASSSHSLPPPLSSPITHVSTLLEIVITTCKPPTESELWGQSRVITVKW